LILELALSRAFRLFVSEALLEEYFAVLCRPRFGFHTRDVLKLMKDIRRASTLVRPRRALSVASDPDDNKE
jgi:predicted nucleic acid-binding protein